MQPVIITGQTGPYTSKTPEGWGKNASSNFKAFNTAPTDEWTPRFEVHYSKPDNVLVRTVKAIVQFIEKPFSNKPLNYRVNMKSLSGYAAQDLKGEETSVEKRPELAAADTDNDKKISAPEGAAFALFQDMLDEHPDIAQTGVADLKTTDADGKITDVGVVNSIGLLLGKSKDKTKQILLDIRNKFELDKKM